MMTWIKKLLLILCLCSVCQAANNFSADANCVSLWRFESGALTTDSKGTNTLSVSGGSPTADAVNYKEGSASCDFESGATDYFTIADAALSAKFPLKNGETNKKISVCFWTKFETAPSGYRGIFSKGDSNKNSLLISGNWGDAKLQLGIGYNEGASSEFKLFSTVCATGVWYHVGVTFNDADKSYKIRIWDDTAGALLGGAEVAGTTTNNINVEDGRVFIGKHPISTYYHDGLIDELVVFNDILTSDEIDLIRSGTYGAGAPPASGGQVIMIQEF